MKDMYLWLRVDDNVTEKDIIKNLSEKGVTYGIHPLPDFDWQAFRREAAKDILCAVLAGGIANGAKGFDAQKEELVNVSIGVADELIKLLKQE